MGTPPSESCHTCVGNTVTIKVLPTYAYTAQCTPPQSGKQFPLMLPVAPMPSSFSDSIFRALPTPDLFSQGRYYFWEFIKHCLKGKKEISRWKARTGVELYETGLLGLIDQHSKRMVLEHTRTCMHIHTHIHIYTHWLTLLNHRIWLKCLQTHVTVKSIYFYAL